LNREADIVIIGGGVIGVCSAYYLASTTGRYVTILEKGEICSGCSYGNGGLLVPSHSLPLASPGAVANALRWMFSPDSPFYIKPRLDADLIRWLLRFWLSSGKRRSHRGIAVLRDLSYASLKLYDELDQLSDVEFQLERRGLIQLCRTQPGLRRCVEHAELLAHHGIKAREVDRDEIATLEPNVETTALGGVYFEEDRHLTPVRFVREMARHVETMGVDILTNTEVLAVENQGSRISGLRTTRGDFRPAEVVLAAGSWSPQLAADLSIRIPIQPAKGYSATFVKPDPSPHMPLVCEEARFGVTPMGDTLRFAGTLELAGLDLSIRERRVRAILSSVPGFLPQLQPDRMELVEIWRGLRPCSPDGLPYIGRVRSVENLVVAAGHAMIGVSLGPITGRLVSQIISGEVPSIELGPLRPDRFG
jgi:D-amino-acid dehydrogenase